MVCLTINSTTSGDHRKPVSEGVAIPPQIPGIGFEGKRDMRHLLADLDV
jgi:hypothetical protein